ncbi:GTP-binding protein LepA [Maribacter sp. 2-571]|uniref:GTP-binding protein LepA n=1 Tax=Maribacter sp. 2-571 TaxID=3417569 RepID=UPI003D32EE87
MTFYIAQFTAKHRIIQLPQHSVFIWKQESGDVDLPLLKNKIKRESAVHFFQMVAGETYPIADEDISVSVEKTAPFSG